MRLSINAKIRCGNASCCKKRLVASGRARDCSRGKRVDEGDFQGVLLWSEVYICKKTLQLPKLLSNCYMTLHEQIMLPD